LLWIGLWGCGGDERGSNVEPTVVDQAEHVDAGEPAHADSHDAGAVPGKHADVDLDTLVAAFLTEYAHEIDVTCPCRVQQHLFPSVQECQRQFGNPIGLVDCATRSLAPSDSPELRASLRCSVERFSQRATCLEMHSCEPDDMNKCYVPEDDCGPTNGEAFTPILFNCLEPMRAQP
jgi:hypothetical protein